MKKKLFKPGLVLMSSLILGATTISSSLVLATEWDSTETNYKNSNLLLENIHYNIDDDLNALANLTIDDLITILENEGIDHKQVFSESEIEKARQDELRTSMSRAGVNKIKYVSKNIRDVYINSYIATTLKYVGFTSVGKYISGWTGLAVGSVGANINTSKGIIVRYQKQNGHYWGVNGYVWAIIGARSQ